MFAEASPYSGMCVGSDVSPDAAVDVPGAGCPVDYMVTGASSYRFVAQPAQWLAAEQDCEDDGMGTHLAVLDATMEEMTIDTLSSASLTWVGASDRKTEGTWLFVTGGTAPDLGNGPSSDCASYYDGTGGGTAGVSDASCMAAQAYVCECDGVAADPASYTP